MHTLYLRPTLRAVTADSEPIPTPAGYRAGRMHRDGVRLGMAVVIVLGMLGVLFVALAGASNAALLSALLWQ